MFKSHTWRQKAVGGGAGRQGTKQPAQRTGIFSFR